MSKNNLQIKLFESGIIEKGDREAIEAFKKAYKKDYDQAYSKAYKEETKRIKITFTIPQDKRLRELSKQYNIPLATLVKNCCFAYLDNTYIHLDESTLFTLEDYHKEMDRRISSIVVHIHTSKEITASDLEDIKFTQSEFRTLIKEALEQPPCLEKWLDYHIQQDEFFISKLLQAVATYLNT